MSRRLKGFRPIVFEFNKRFCLRATVAVAICSLALLLFSIMPSRSSARGFNPVVVAANPTSGTLSPANRTLAYTGGPFVIPTNSTDSAAGPVDCDQANPCEDYSLTIDIPAEYKTANPNDYVRVEVTWNDFSGAQDLDIFLVDNPDDRTYPARGANGSANPEVFTVPVRSLAANQYLVRVVPFISTGQAYNTSIALISPPAPTPTPTPTTFSGIAPRYYNYSPGPGIGENAGEPTIGFNPFTKRAMYVSGLQTLKVTFPEEISPAGSVAGSCDAHYWPSLIRSSRRRRSARV